MFQDRFQYLTMQQLEAIVALVREGRFGLAAQAMLLSQPALTKNIKKAEEYVGMRLFHRNRAGVSLTAEGKIIYDYAKRILTLRDEAREKILSRKHERSGRICLSASTIPGTYLLPRVLSAFKERYPDVHVSVKMADSEEAMNMVLDHEVEMGIIGKKPIHKQLVAEKLWNDRLVLVVPRGHPWHVGKSVSLQALAKEPFVCRERGSATRELFERSLRGKFPQGLLEFNIRAELGSSEAVKEAVVCGLGVSVISIHAVERELVQKMLFAVPLKDWSLERNFYLIYERHKTRQGFYSYHKAFIDFIKGRF